MQKEAFFKNCRNDKDLKWFLMLDEGRSSVVSSFYCYF